MLFELWVCIYIVCEVQVRFSYSMYVGYVNLQTYMYCLGPFSSKLARNSACLKLVNFIIYIVVSWVKAPCS